MTTQTRDRAHPTPRLSHDPSQPHRGGTWSPAWTRLRRWFRRLPRPTVALVPVEEPSPASKVVSYALSVIAACVVALAVCLTLVGPMQHFTAQHRLYGQLRLGLAEGSLPVGQTDASGNLVAPGTPLALVSIPAIGVNEVAVEGTTSTQTMKGIGLRRDTVLPGQAGVSVLMGRAHAYGGVFAHLDRLAPGDRVSITTSQGRATFQVVDTRVGDSPAPSLAAGGSRIVLTTATGPAYMPTGELHVDADLLGKPFATPAISVIPGSIPASESALGADTSVLFALSWLLELLIVAIVAGLWAWRRWDRRAAWLIFVPVVAAAWIAVGTEVCRLMPNLM